MNLLAIDTSTQIATVAISCENKILHHQEPTLRNHAALILPIIDNLLKDADLTISDIDGIVFGRGPGSFTGLRISCSVAQGLAYANDLPIYPVSTLAAIAYKTKKLVQKAAGLNILATLDARMHQLYWGVLSNKNKNYKFQEFVSDPIDLVLPQESEIILAGVGWSQYLSEFDSSLMNKIVHMQEIYPQAEEMLKMVQEGLIHPISPEEAIPTYIRDKVTK